MGEPDLTVEIDPLTRKDSLELRPPAREEGAGSRYGRVECSLVHTKGDPAGKKEHGDKGNTLTEEEISRNRTAGICLGETHSAPLYKPSAVRVEFGRGKAQMFDPHAAQDQIRKEEEARLLEQENCEACRLQSELDYKRATWRWRKVMVVNAQCSTRARRYPSKRYIGEGEFLVGIENAREVLPAAKIPPVKQRTAHATSKSATEGSGKPQTKG